MPPQARVFALWRDEPLQYFATDAGMQIEPGPSINQIRFSFSPGHYGPGVAENTQETLEIPKAPI